MDIDLIRTFIEVYRLRHFGSAAKSLHVTQAAISARVKLLEHHLGAQLFDRSKREVRVTAEGHIFLHTADIILSEWRNAQQKLGHYGKKTDQLSIAGSLRLWNIFLQENWLNKLRLTRPDLALNVYTGETNYLINKLFEGTLDVIISLDPPRMELMSVVHLETLDIALVSTKPNLRAEEVLNHDDFILVDWGQSFEIEFHQYYPEQNTSLTSVSDCDIALRLIESIGGSAFIPLRTAINKIKSRQLFPVSNSPIITKDVYGSFLHRNPKLSIIQESLDVLNLGKRVKPEELGYDN